MLDKKMVWNKFIRITHWLVAVTIVLNMFVFADGDDLHIWLGYIGAGIVLLRLAYGLLSRDQAHSLSHFPLSPATLFRFLKDKINHRDHAYKGHNPAASWIYILIWVCVAGLTITGWMLSLDRFFGSDEVEEVHVYFNTAMQVTIIIHLLGMLIDSIQFKRKAWMGMLNGRK